MSSRENRRRRHRRHKARTARKWVLQAGWLEARQIEERFARMHGLSPGEMHRRLRAEREVRPGTLLVELELRTSDVETRRGQLVRLTATPLDSGNRRLLERSICADAQIDPVFESMEVARGVTRASLVDRCGALIGPELARWAADAARAARGASMRLASSPPLFPGFYTDAAAAADPRA